jgi:hypothetical protein
MRAGVIARLFLVHMQFEYLKIRIRIEVAGMCRNGMTIVMVWATLVVATETIEVSVIVARLLEASVGVAADGLDVLVVRGGILGFTTGGGRIG